MSARRTLLILASTFTCMSICILALARAGGDLPAPQASAAATEDVRLDLQQQLGHLQVENGQVIVTTRTGQRRLTPQEFARALEASQGEARSRPLIMRLANAQGLGGLVWVGFGLLGQFIFMGRMIVQWLASERNRRSVVPVAFWWMSLCGGTMVLLYFIWRRDPVGILGQMMGWMIYSRNLWLIYRPNARSTVAQLPSDAAGA